MHNINYEEVRMYMIEWNMNTLDSDEIQDAIVEVYMDEFHFTDRELMLYALEFLNFLFKDT